MAVITTIISIILLVPPLGYAYFNFAVNRPAQTDREETFEIKSGESIPQIAKALVEKNLINSEFLFTAYMYMNKMDTKVQAGVYVIKAGTSVKELAEQFKLGRNDVSITFLEGWRVEEFADEAVSKLKNISRRRFIETAANLEGKLFPDTYVVNQDIQEEELVTLLTTTFEAKALPKIQEQNKLFNTTQFTDSEAYVLASLVEREANNDEDRKLIAGILVNRFKSGQRLDVDATTQYTVASLKACPNNPTSGTCLEDEPINPNGTIYSWWPKELTVDDLALNSPYNTRKVAGLPPAPISSFSLSSLEAVLNYTESDFNFYLTDNEGVTHYAKTLSEHEANISKYL